MMHIKIERYVIPMKTYNPNHLFEPGKDEIVYKRVNSVNTIKYNENEDHGLLDATSATPFIHFPNLDKIPFIRHGFSTRLGGASKEYFSTLNLSFARGDEEEAVIENYKRITRAMGMEGQSLVFSDQVHDTLVHRVTKADVLEDFPYAKHLVGIDGLITNETGLVLVTSYADCVPLYFVDPVNKAIGLSHSGWKGTVGKIGKKTIEAMSNEFGTKPEEVIAVIGPSICFDCYEISENVATQFMENFSDDIVRQILYYKGMGKYHLDLWLTNKHILMEAGVKESNIANSNICTNCNSSLLFSHRASGGKRGNLAAFLSIATN